MNLEKLCELACVAALKAGEEIAAIKHPLVTTKPDGSVLTSADLRANEIICEHLKSSQIAICSEEALLGYEHRKIAKSFWLIDPLDGSTNYLKNRQNYCVCIALICGNRPVIGVIYDVKNKNLYSGFKGGGVRKNAKLLEAAQSPTYRAVLSMRRDSSHLNEGFIIAQNYEAMSIGSALKFCAILDGQADMYARFDSLNSWDIAAGDFLINEQGGLMIGLDHKMLDYNQPDFGCAPFIAVSYAGGKEKDSDD